MKRKSNARRILTQGKPLITGCREEIIGAKPTFTPTKKKRKKTITTFAAMTARITEWVGTIATPIGKAGTGKL